MAKKTLKNSNIRRRILEAARERFFRAGFSKVTTEEIASDLGVSKKTLYGSFPSKEALLKGVMEMTMKETSSYVRRLISDNSMDFVEKLRVLLNFLGTFLSGVGRPFLQDIQKNAPDLWREIERFRQEQILANFGKMLKEGARKGAFRKDISPQLLVPMYINLVQTMINPEFLAGLPFSASDVFESIIRVSLEGILTDKARVRYRLAQKRA